MNKRIISLFILLPILFVLSGCGQSGPLYLPKPKPQTQMKTKTTVPSHAKHYAKKS